MSQREVVSATFPSTGPITLRYCGPNNRSCIVEAPEVMARALQSSYNNPDSADVVFLFNDEDEKKRKIYCHSIILRQRSPVLKEILDNTTQREFQFETLFPTMNRKCFIQLLKYMYKEKLRFPEDDLQIELHNAASLLGMEEAKNAIRGWFSSFLDPIQAIEVGIEALRRGHHHIFNVCFNIFSVVAPILVEKASHVLMNADPQFITHFVSSSLVEVNEIDLFEFIAKYCEHNSEKYGMTPRDFFKLHFEKYIRYPFMTPKELYTHFANPYARYADWVDRQYIVEAFKYNALGRKTTPSFFSPRMQPRESAYYLAEWSVPQYCASMITFTNNKRTVTKVSGGGSWNCVAYVPIKRSCHITVHVDCTNSDKSGLAIGIGSLSSIDEPSNYSSIVSTHYNAPSGCRFGNPSIGSVITFVIGYAENTIRIFENGRDCGVSPKTPKDFGGQLALIAYLYYEKNSVSIHRGKMPV